MSTFNYTFTRFHDVVALLLKHEGGYVHNAKDPGGATNMGITLATLERWRGEKCTPADVKAMSELEARQIYFAFYWNPVRADELAPGVDYMVFDFAVNGGPRRSALFLQEVVGAEMDGVIGPKTLGATRTIPPVGIVRAFHDVKMDFYRRVRHPRTGALLWDTFGKGWSRRANEVKARAYSMMGHRPGVGEA